MAHYKAADYFNPGVDFILDIGGQDMKAMRIRDGALSSIQLMKLVHQVVVHSLKPLPIH